MPRELEHQLNDAGAEAIIILENFAHVLEKIAANTAVKHVVVTSLGEMLGLKGMIVNFVVRHLKKLVPNYSLPGAVTFSEALAEGKQHALKPVALGPDDIAFLQYTGGTTGVAKGAMLTHKNIVANTLQSDAWLQPALKISAEKRGPQQFICVTALPLYHIFALTACFFLTMRNGGMCILIPNPRDLKSLIHDVARYKILELPRGEHAV